MFLQRVTTSSAQVLPLFLVNVLLSPFPVATALRHFVLGQQQLQNQPYLPLFNKNSANTNSYPELAPFDAPMLASRCLIVGEQNSLPGENLGLPCQACLNL